MRLGSANTYDRALQNLYSRQTELSNQQEKLTSGKNVNRPSDDPTGAAQAERALTRLARISSDNRSLEVQRSAITLAESTLADATSLVQKLRELVISAGNAGYSASDRKSVAQEMTGVRDQLFALANARDANGTPLFGGLGSASAPFTDSSSGVSFNGVAGQRASTETSIPGTMDGQAVWMNVASGNGSFALSTGTGNTGNLWTNTGQVLTPASLPAASGQVPPSTSFMSGRNFRWFGRFWTYAISLPPSSGALSRKASSAPFGPADTSPHPTACKGSSPP